MTESAKDAYNTTAEKTSEVLASVTRLQRVSSKVSKIVEFQSADWLAHHAKDAYNTTAEKASEVSTVALVYCRTSQRE